MRTEPLPFEPMPRVALWLHSREGWTQHLSAENDAEHVRYLRRCGEKLLAGGTISEFEVRENDFEGRERVLFHRHRV